MAMLRNSVINLLLKTGISLPLLYAALAAFIVPSKVITRWPFFISRYVDEGTLSAFTGIACVALVIWIFFGARKFLSAISLTICIGLAGLFNIKSGSFLFVLAPIFFTALALSVRYYPRVRVVSETFVTPLHEGHLSGESEREDRNSKISGQSDNSNNHGSYPSRPAR